MTEPPTVTAFKPENDQATRVDQLDRGPLMRAFATEVMTCTPPHAFAVHGDWGAGKTSFLLQLQGHLREAGFQKKATVVWFEAWRHQKEPVPVVALLHEVRKHFSMLAGLKQGAKRAGAIIMSGLLNCIGELIERITLERAVLPDQEAIRKYAERYDTERFNNPLASSRIREALEDAVTEVFNHLKMPGARLVIVVDDLDRCSPGATYRLLEELKIYLDLSNCVFVLGIHQNEVVKSIAKALTCDLAEATAYLEKLCPSVLRLPLHGHPQDLLLKWLEGCNAHPHVQRLFKASPDLYRSCIPPNPRRIKALANAVGRLWSHSAQLSCHPEKILAAARVGDTLDPDEQQTAIDRAQKAAQRLLLVAYVAQFHASLYQRWQHSGAIWDMLKDWAHMGETTTPERAEVFGQMRLPHAAPRTAVSNPNLRGDDRLPPGTMTESFAPDYIDPGQPGVFWMARLVHALRQEPADAFQPLLNARLG